LTLVSNEKLGRGIACSLVTRDARQETSYPLLRYSFTFGWI
jgi:hypothetical protein